MADRHRIVLVGGIPVDRIKAAVDDMPLRQLALDLSDGPKNTSWTDLTLAHDLLIRLADALEVPDADT